MIPDGEEVQQDYIPDIIEALSLPKNHTLKEIWTYYESLAQSHVPTRTYDDTLKIRKQVQETLLTKKRRFPKPTMYVARKPQDEIKSLNVTPPPPRPRRKKQRIDYENRIEIYKKLCELPDEERHEYFCHL